jgi:hypothetical protein
MASKRCTKCGAEKPLEEFPRKRTSRDGRATRCKQCVKIMRPLVGTLLQTRREASASATHRVCRNCGINKPLGEFHRAHKGLYGRKAICSTCTGAKRTDRRRHQLKSKYGITPADYERLLEQQGGCCAICGSHDSYGKTNRLAVDHDHETGEVRALLCNKCNPAIGLMDDDPERLEAAASYLRAFKRG